MPDFMYLGGNAGKGLLESALAQPRQTFGGQFLYRTVFDKAATLLCSVIKNHALVDGNKRMGLTTVAVFLALNGYFFHAPMGEAIDRCVRIAETKGTTEQKEVAKWLRARSVSFEKYPAMRPEEIEYWSVAADRTLTLLKNRVQVTSEVARATRAISEPDRA